MAKIALSIGGVALGTFLGGPLGALAFLGPSVGGALGGLIGTEVGGVIDKAIFGTNKVQGPRLSDLSVQVSTYGKTIPIAYGRMRLAGNMIWAEDLMEVSHTSSSGKGSAASSESTVTYHYYGTFAISICVGEIDEIVRVWADSLELSDDDLQSSSANYETYLGTETQGESTIMAAYLGTGYTPAYREQAYVVIKDFPLEKYGNRIPNFTFEIVRQQRVTGEAEDLVKSVVMIPCAGEYVYDTTIQTKTSGTRSSSGKFISSGSTSYMNMQNYSSQANFLESVDQLALTLPNVEWVSLTVAWFATSKYCNKLTIIPKTEFSYSVGSVSPDEWAVGSYTRDTSEQVLTFSDGTLTYGGTPTDKSVIRALTELKSRGYKVVFYPILLIDTTTDNDSTEDDKPWRGHIVPTSTSDVTSFFTAYNTFIEHYLNLSVSGTTLKSKIDAFIIGSELVGLTGWTSDSAGTYPAVTQLKSLAATAKTALGSSIYVIYAANWSEYHSTGGWFNMDPLWSDSNIDIIGIDAYFPITPDLSQSQISESKIINYWEAGEGWDYYYDDSTNRNSNLISNPLIAVSGSSTVTLSLSGFNETSVVAGDYITLAGLTSTGGISAGNLNGSRLVLSVSGSSSLTFTAGASATSSATGGGSSGTFNKPKYYTGNAYAWKNVEYWWENTHTNPNSSTTAWTAKAKPIWFTEYGFPSVDACSNEPNVFYDPTSSESAFPRESKGRIDYSAQRTAITATETYLGDRNAESGKSNLVPRRFLWTWDARPYPFWPDLTTVWGDTSQWTYGHWVNGKFGVSTLEGIVSDLLETAGITSDYYDVTNLTDSVDGYIITQVGTCRSRLEELQAGYFFDMAESDGKIKFVKREDQESQVTIPEDDFIPTSKSPIRQIVSMTRTQELDLPQKVTVGYLNRLSNYQQSTQISQRQTTFSVQQSTTSLPLVLSNQDAKNIADTTLYSAWIGRNSFSFKLPPKYVYLEPTDIITLTINNVEHEVRLTSIKISQFGLLECTASSEDVATYDFYLTPGSGITATLTQPSTLSFQTGSTLLTLLDTNCLPQDSDSSGVLRIVMAANITDWKGSSLYRSDDGGIDGGNTWSLIDSTANTVTMGYATTSLSDGNAYVTDVANTVDIYLTSGSLSSITQTALLNGGNVCIIGSEILQFQTATVLNSDSKQVRLSNLLRGRQGTESYTGAHTADEVFVLLDSTVDKTNISLSLINQLRYYKPVTTGSTLTDTDEQSFTYTGAMFKPWSVVNVKGSIESNDWTITWIRRTRFGGGLVDYVDIPLNEESESYQIDIMDGTTVVRTLYATTSSISYTSSQQITDFGSNQTSISVNIYQVSTVVGRGYGTSASLSG